MIHLVLKAARVRLALKSLVDLSLVALSLAS
jgi:hypothetical protein